MDNKSFGISAFFPCYNDAGTIASMVVLAINTLGSITGDCEVIVIDDGSSDGSQSILKELQKKYDNLRLIFHGTNKGYGGALRSGFAAATKELVFYTDGDFQYDVREMTKLVPFMTDGVDIVNGYKVKRCDPLHRIIIGHIYNYSMKWLFGIKIKDIDCDFRLIRRSVFERTHLEHDSGVICLEMVKKFQDAGCKFAEVPVSHYFRAYGKSQFFNFRRILRVGRDVLKLWWSLVILKKIAVLRNRKCASTKRYTEEKIS